MKHLIVTFVIALLAGCAASTSTTTEHYVEKYIPSKFDSTVNMKFAELAVMNKEAVLQCNKPSFSLTAKDLDRKANVLVSATRYAYTDVMRIANSISVNYGEMLRTYNNGGVPPSETYCETKLRINGANIDRALSILGDKAK